VTRRLRATPLTRILVVAAAIVGATLSTAPAAVAGTTTPTAHVYDADGNVIETPFVPGPAQRRLNEARATRVFLEHDKVADWVARYPDDITTDASFDDATRAWHVKVWWGEAGQIADGRVDDASETVLEAWTGPQVAWKMARGYSGAFGGRTINRPLVWLLLCGAFVVGLANFRRPLSLRNLDIAALLAFSISLWAFNRGEVFWSVPLAYPPMLYLLGRLAWVGVRGRRRATGSAPLWPIWVLAAATVFLAGFRVGINVQDSNVIDVGYSGVIGAHRIANGQSPYGHFPVEAGRKECGPADAEGTVRLRIQTNGRCEHANERGDTYGPVAYEAYLPGYWIFGWNGHWAGEKLWAAHLSSLLFDLLCLVGLALVGLRFGGRRLAVTLAFAWVAYPFTQFASSSNTNDSILPAFLIFGFWLASSPWGRGSMLALAGWTKFAPLLLVPLWLTYPEASRRRLGSMARFAAAFVVTTALAFTVLLLEPDVIEAARTFWDRTIGFQVGRESPFSLWGWGQYHARGVPDLHLVQRVLQLLVVASALVVAFVPRRKTPLQLAALTGAVLIGFELVLTHWFYLYIPWFFPFVAFALLDVSEPAPAPEPEPPPHEHEPRELVAAG
jgi:hypothetical protein